MLEKIEKLNKTIEKLMLDKTKADAQKEVWETKLNESIKDYKSKYGVDLSGKSLSDLKVNLQKEMEIVEAKTKEEYEQASKVVALIEEGDIKGAWKILGVEMDAQPEVEISEADKQQEELQGVEDVVEELDSVEDSDFLGAGSSEEEPVEEPVKEEPTPKPMFGGISFEDDDDDDDFIKQDTEESNDDDDEDSDFSGFGQILKGSKFQP